MKTDIDFWQLCQSFADQEGTVLFYSGGNYCTAKQSYLCLLPTEKIVIELQDNKNPWVELKHSLSFSGEDNDLPAWVGYLSYEIGAFSDAEQQLPFYKPPIPLAIFYKPSIVIKCDKESHAFSFYRHKESSLQCIKQTSFEEYAQMIAIAKRHILDGNIYQVNLSHETLFEGQFCPFSYFKNVILSNPAPFAAFMNAGDFTLISSSPERLIKKCGNELQAIPIKGTRPRGQNEQDDKKQIEALQSSVKERAELLMITDLLRNDLGKISLPGSVQVPELFHLETYQNVFHLSSLISSKAKDCHPIDILRAVFPGGSISGCPKLKALEIIYDLEKRPRHIYTGSIGYLTNRGDFDFNIAIRTCLYQDQLLNIQLGAGIVFDSDPEQEYLETLAKGATLFGALK